LKFGEFLGVEFGHLLAQLEATDDLLHLWLIDDGCEPTVDVTVWLSEFRVQDMFVQSQECGSNTNVSQTDTLTNQVCTG